MTTAKELLKTDFVKFDVTDSVSKFMGRMKSTGETYAILFKGKEYAGYADKKMLVKTRTDTDSMRLSNLLKGVRTLKSNDDEKTMAKAFIDSDTRTLPVFEGKDLVGVVNAKDLAFEIKDRFGNLKVESLATIRNLVVLEENDTVGKAIHEMHNGKIDRAPVVDQNRNFVGILTLVDLQIQQSSIDRSKQKTGKGSSQGKDKKGATEKASLGDMQIKNIMTSMNCCTANLNDKASDVIENMHECEVTSCVLLEDKKPSGIITVHDVLLGFLKI
ncbi:MAG: CBS domain-containing protein [Nanoarchaeota archaeon]